MYDNKYKTRYNVIDRVHRYYVAHRLHLASDSFSCYDNGVYSEINVSDLDCYNDVTFVYITRCTSGNSPTPVSSSGTI